MRILLLKILLIASFISLGQGKNHTWLHCYYPPKARLNFDSNSYQLITESRKMSFRAAQANISDESGNLLIVSNGCWIANANGDTMQNGSGLNPGAFANDWCDSVGGNPVPHGNVILPWPNDINRYILFHMIADYNNHNLAWPTKLYYSVIDMSLDNGLGEVIQKNIVLIQDQLGMGLAACKHANGRDWWIHSLKDSSNLIYTILLTPNGIDTIFTQQLNVPIEQFHQGQPTFSPDGKKFAYSYTNGPLGNMYHNVRISDFDRCSGLFSNTVIVDISDTYAGIGLAFSPNSKFLYASSWQRVFQINTDTTVIQASLDTVAVNDGFYSPQPPFQTDFWLMYLAANGKIYISSGNGVLHLHYINYPDSDGVACDVQQHALLMPNFTVRGNVFHPNYYLGCDTTCTPCLVSVDEITYDFKFNIYPNPSSGNFNMIYLLPQNKEGKLEVFDVTGKIVYEMRLPQWSTLQQFNLSNLSEGIYAVKISSAGYSVVRKLIITR